MFIKKLIYTNYINYLFIQFTRNSDLQIKKFDTMYVYNSITFLLAFQQKKEIVVVFQVANNLWNSLLEPVGNKSTSWTPIFEKFLCPTSERPFLMTRENSK